MIHSRNAHRIARTARKIKSQVARPLCLAKSLSQRLEQQIGRDPSNDADAADRLAIPDKVHRIPHIATLGTDIDRIIHGVFLAFPENLRKVAMAASDRQFSMKSMVARLSSDAGSAELDESFNTDLVAWTACRGSRARP
jgi:hypothetical protein